MVWRVENGPEETGVLVRKIKIKKERWRIAGMYVNGGKLETIGRLDGKEGRRVAHDSGERF